jgi:integrase/recombinase XerD
MFMLAGAMKAKNTNQTKNKSTRKNNAAALASSVWYQEFVRFVELRDIAPRTRVSYLAWVRRLHEARPGRDITTLSEGEALDFLIALRHERGLKDSTVNQAACALRGFFRDHLGRDWKAWSKIKIRREEQLPNVLSRDEVAKFLGAVRVGRFRAMFTLMYHCGLRLGEVIRLKPGHIDGKRRVLRVVGGKGAKDRDIPLSDELLARLRAFWKQHRNPEWMFPAPGRGWMTAGSTLGQALHRSDRHLSDSAVQAAMPRQTPGHLPHVAPLLRHAPLGRRCLRAARQPVSRPQFAQAHARLPAPHRGERERRARGHREIPRSLTPRPHAAGA